MSGWSYAFSQLVVLLAIAAVLGVVAGALIARWQSASTAAVTPGRPEVVADLRSRLASSEATVATLTAELREFRDNKEVELGALESGAIRALDSTIAANRARESDLEQRLEEARSANRKGEEDLHLVERRVLSLEQAITERDKLLVALQERMEELGR